jgi:hypothetical protein
LDGSVSSWRERIQQAVTARLLDRTVKVRAVIVMTGPDAPRAMSSWSLEAAAAITTEQDFASVVGPFLAVEPYKVIVPVVGQLRSMKS